MNTYELKQEAKRQRLEDAADRAEARSNAAYGRADMRESASGIPLGQPILVGHHSEGRHRAAIRRADNAMRKSVEEGKKAGKLRAKAAAVGTGGVSSDDPDAIKKLRNKADQLQEMQEMMKACNAALRPFKKNGDFEALVARIEPIKGVKDARKLADQLRTPDFSNRMGFASYQLTNNNANIKRIRARIEQLEKASQRDYVELERDGYKVVQNVEENRLQFIFDGKPSEEVRAVMKSNGFRWAPSVKAWQRQLNNRAIHMGQCAMREIAAI